jgi:nucleoside-diphosphate-sugar epimerase
MRPRKPSIMVTGASGYIGRLIAATLLEREPQTTTILAPIRANHDHAKLRSLIADELPTRDADVRARMLDRLVFLPLPPTGSFATQLVPHLLQALNEYELVSVVHAAGCLSYFNEAKLREGNEELTTLMLELARTLGVGMFVYLSTAFCSGYQNEPIPEALHGDPPSDPNEYTKSKRRTESIVASSGVPFQIHRPSVVVGRSTDGYYSGKPYGAYQIWTGLCRFLCDRFRNVIHVVAPEVPLNVVHQDAVQAGFYAAFESLPAGAIVHLVSRRAAVPTARECWHLWMEACGRPAEVYYYDQLSDLDRTSLDEPQRLLVEFGEANIEISTHDWQFETGALDLLRHRTLHYPDATLSSMASCLDWFLARNASAQAFMSAHAPLRAGVRPIVVPVPAGSGRETATLRPTAMRPN